VVQQAKRGTYSRTALSMAHDTDIDTDTNNSQIVAEDSLP